jgi:hypothetical protein
MLSTSNISLWHSSGIPVLWLSKFKLDKFHLEMAAELFTIEQKKNYTLAPGSIIT